MITLRKKLGTMCAEVLIDDVVAGEVEFKNYEPVNQGGGPAWRWRQGGEWGDAESLASAIDVVAARHAGKHPL